MLARVNLKPTIAHNVAKKMLKAREKAKTERYNKNKKD